MSAKEYRFSEDELQKLIRSVSEDVTAQVTAKMAPAGLMTINQVAEKYPMSPGKVRQLILCGQIAHVRIGKKYLVHEHDMDKYLAANRVGSSVQAL